ncbi:ATP-binding protein [Echinimonas agarilytica]|uniref:histidine kinase n=1 Tax=Echinimonas agarilytica TaxID=1215918 RepID=A0AA42B829_9GAMM|nr:ATP-binding protein [Echinimonas agarilytica]MCM2680557.1 ATP-binding protein [Echinimonas agarilytica]
MTDRIARLIPSSLPARVLALVLGALLLSQLVISLVWYTQQQSQDNENLRITSQWIAEQVDYTVSNFSGMTAQRRQLVLNTLSNVGSNRFFMVLNDRPIFLEPAPSNFQRRILLSQVVQQLRSTQHQGRPAAVSLVNAAELINSTRDLNIKEQATVWARHNLLDPSQPPPLLTVQAPMPDKQWLMIVTVLPEPYTMLSPLQFEMPQWWFMALTSIVLLAVVYLITQWLTQPLEKLAEAADLLGRDIDSSPIDETGSSEVIRAARAFNAMQNRIRRYIKDRETLFSAISHDLKTPITRMRLRAELLEDDEHRERFIANLDELDLMVKGALQSVKDSDIHENLEAIDINEILKQIQLDLAKDAWRLRITGGLDEPFMGKPLALKRCISNLVDNAIQYGESVHVIIREREDGVYLYFHDQGPGVPMVDRERIFEPYVRLDNSRNREGGTGLGMGIVRNIVQGHGGQIALSNHPHGGLLVRVLLPRR